MAEVWITNAAPSQFKIVSGARIGPPKASFSSFSIEKLKQWGYVEIYRTGEDAPVIEWMTEGMGVLDAQ